MSYREQKEKAEKRKSLWKKILLFALVAVLLVGVVFACIVPPESWKYYFKKPRVAKREQGELRMHFLDVGQGDSTLIELPDGKVMLIDAGREDSHSKKQMMRYLNALKIEEIDYLVATHTDGDHVGGLTEVFRYKTVKTAYMTADFSLTDVAYATAYQSALAEGCEIVEPTRSVRIVGEAYSLEFLYPYAVGENEYDNESSVVLWLEYKEKRALFCGDITDKGEEDLIRDDRLGILSAYGAWLAGTDILKVAHHGSKSSSSKAFLEYVRPKSAVISCGKGNDYGHPNEWVLRRLESVGSNIYRTDTQGTVVLSITATGEVVKK